MPRNFISHNTKVLVLPFNRYSVLRRRCYNLECMTDLDKSSFHFSRWETDLMELASNDHIAPCCCPRVRIRWFLTRTSRPHFPPVHFVRECMIRSCFSETKINLENRAGVLSKSLGDGLRANLLYLENFMSPTIHALLRVD